MGRSKNVRSKRERKIIEEAIAVKPTDARDPALPARDDWDGIEQYVVERPHLSLFKLSRELGLAWSPFYIEARKRGVTEKRDAVVAQIIADARARLAHDIAERVTTGVLEFYEQVKTLRRALFDAQIKRAEWKARVLESWTKDADGGRPIEKRLVTERPGLDSHGKPNGTVQRVEATFRDPPEDVRLLELLAKLETELEDKLLGLRPVSGRGIPCDGGYGIADTPAKLRSIAVDVAASVRDAALTYDASLLVIPDAVGAGPVPGVAAPVLDVDVAGDDAPAEEGGEVEATP